MLGLPGGLRWVAQHDPAAYDPPHRFVDELSRSGPRSWPPAIIGTGGTPTSSPPRAPEATLVPDRVDTPVPGAALRSTFVYRHRQLADDLAAHRDAADTGAHP